MTKLTEKKRFDIKNKKIILICDNILNNINIIADSYNMDDVDIKPFEYDVKLIKQIMGYNK